MEINDKSSIDITVTEADTAKSIAIDTSDNFPAVYATSKMVAIMELAAARLMKPLLKSGELSVGVSVDIKHLAPTLVGGKIISSATFVGMEGKLYQFKVEVNDDGGIAGVGFHTRAIVETERLLEGARRRLNN